MRRFTSALVLGILVIIAACSTQSSTSAAHPLIPTATPVTSVHYRALVHALNHSGVTGSVDMLVQGLTMQTTIHLQGLSPNHRHQQHVHGDSVMQSVCPTAADAGPDGIITVDATIKRAGPVAIDLTPYPIADQQGAEDWSQNVDLLGANIGDAVPLTEFVVVIHGMERSRGYDDTFPVACGSIEIV
jgi:hypothetical protein